MSIRAYRDIHRRKSRQIMVGKVPVGGDAPITVQTMTNTVTGDARATIDQIRRIEEAGCDIVRVSCPDEDATKAMKAIRSWLSTIPVVADIHFHYKRAPHRGGGEWRGLALRTAISGGSAPAGFQGSRARQPGIMAAPCASCVNAGSLSLTCWRNTASHAPKPWWRAPLNHARILDDLDFREYKISVKASDPFLAVAAYQALSEAIDCPLHLGITEAGGIDFRHSEILHRHGHAVVERPPKRRRAASSIR